MSLLEWYQYLPQKVSPYLFEIGSFQVRWYSLGYIACFIIFWILSAYRLKRDKLTFKLTLKDVEDSLLYMFLGVLIGGRLGYSFFYGWDDFISAPYMVLLPFSFDNGIKLVGFAGMSYHGALVGVIGSVALFCKLRGIMLLRYFDFIVPCFVLGYTFGRLGNFTNGELYGRITELPIGMYFYHYVWEGGAVVKKVFTELRHPSQLYEAFFEGVVLFGIFWPLRNSRLVKLPGTMAGLYFMAYGLVRFMIEFLREPDSQFKGDGNALGSVLGFMTMGQVLCIVMIIVGVLVVALSHKFAHKLAHKEGITSTSKKS